MICEKFELLVEEFTKELQQQGIAEINHRFTNGNGIVWKATLRRMKGVK